MDRTGAGQHDGRVQHGQRYARPPWIQVRALQRYEPLQCSTVQIRGTAVVKSSTSDVILGEIFFLSRVPEDLQGLFPSVSEMD